MTEQGYEVIPIDETYDVLTTIAEVDSDLEEVKEEENEKQKGDVNNKNEAVEEDKICNVEDDPEFESSWKLWYQTKLNSELLEAVIKCKHEDVNRLLKSGASPLARCRQSMASACHLAALLGEELILEKLLAECTESSCIQRAVTSRDRKGRQPHHLAAATGRIKIVNMILREEPSLIDSRVVRENLEGELAGVEEKELDSFLHNHKAVTNLLFDVDEGSTALHLAFRSDDIELVEYLLDNSANQDILDSFHRTPASVAAGLLLSPLKRKMGEKVHFEGFSSSGVGSPAVHFSPMSNPTRSPNYQRSRDQSSQKKSNDFRTLESALRILKRQVNTGGEKPRGPNFLHTLVQNADIEKIKNFIDKCKEEHPGLLAIMVKWPDERGQTPAHLAASLQLLDPLRILLDVDDVDVLNEVDTEGKTMLFTAVESRWLAGVEEILKHRPNLSLAPFASEENVLHVAARFKDEELLRTLLSHSTNEVLQKRDRNQFTPLERAVKSSSLQCIELLFRRLKDSINESSLVKLAITADNGDPLKKLQFLIQILELSDHELKTIVEEEALLHVAVRENSLECLKFLLSMPNIKVNSREENDQCILHIAAKIGRVEAMEIILDNPQGSMLIASHDVHQREPLITAAVNGNMDCVVLLLKRGANLAAWDKHLRKNAIDIIFRNNPQLDWIIDEVFDSFLVKNKEMNNNVFIDLNFKGLLADSKVPDVEETRSKTQEKQSSKQTNIQPERRQLGVVEAFINCDQDWLMQKVFLHPIVESFIYFKWKFLKLFFYFTVFLHVAQILSVTIFSLILFTYEITSWVWISRVAVWCTATPVIILESLFVRLEKKYIWEEETWVRWMVLGCGLLVSVLPGVAIMRYLAAVVVLLAWIELLFLNACNPLCGLRILMFTEVAKNVFQVLSTFIFLILGFAFSFQILFNGAQPFTNLWTSLTKVFIMMAELEYGDVFDPEKDIALPVDVLGRVFYIAFLVLVVMILTNLMVGMSVSDVAALEAHGKSRKTAKEAIFLVMFEKICYFDVFLNLLPSCLSDYIKRERKLHSDVVRISTNRCSQSSDQRNKMTEIPGQIRNDVIEVLRKVEEEKQKVDVYSAINEIRQKLNK